ncbi:MAG TPA: glycogen-binding domain-containing protein [Phycisphaerae bacterium]|nr:glycogen-binding domain-containing protein [Phycisphaerae bacterium]
MIRRNSNGEYEFRLNLPAAHEVMLVGDFEPVAPSQVPMSRSPSGDWVCKLQLCEGVYHFKYWVDGKWCLDGDARTTPAASFLTSTLVVHDEHAVSFGYSG